MNLTEDEIRAIAKSKKTISAKRIAAVRILRNFEMPDLADFDPLLLGEKTPGEMRADGVNTEVLKKVKSRTRTTTTPDGGHTVEVEREIELRDTGMKEAEFLIHETDGAVEERMVIRGLPTMIVFGAEQDGAFDIPPAALPALGDGDGGG